MILGTGFVDLTPTLGVVLEVVVLETADCLFPLAVAVAVAVAVFVAVDDDGVVVVGVAVGPEDEAVVVSGFFFCLNLAISAAFLSRSISSSAFLFGTNSFAATFKPPLLPPTPPAAVVFEGLLSPPSPEVLGTLMRFKFKLTCFLYSLNVRFRRWDYRQKRYYLQDRTTWKVMKWDTCLQIINKDRER